MPLLIAAAIVIVIVLVIAWIQDYLVKRRRDKLQARAEALGLRPLDTDAQTLLGKTRGFLLFTHGARETVGQVAKDQVTRRGHPVEVTVFTYSFNIPMGRYLRNWRQTVLRFTSPELDLPNFSVTPGIAFEQITGHIRDQDTREQLIGTAGLHFKGHTDFSNRMHVWGPDRTRVQALLDPELLRFFEGDGSAAHYDLCVEGKDSAILVYYYDREVPAEEFEAFLETGWEVCDLLLLKEGDHA